MKKIFHKNQLIITTLAFMLAIAGYISYDRATGKEKATQTNADAVAEEYTIDNTTYDIFEEIDSTETMGEDVKTDAENEVALEETSDGAGIEVADLNTDAQDAALESEDAIFDQEDILNPGETVLTSVNLTGANYAAEVKLNREQVRSRNKDALLEIIDNESISEEQKQDAINEMVSLTDIAEKEANAEMLLEAKGFTNVVVSISDDTCDVVVDMGDVTDAKRAQIEDIVKRKTGISAENIIITAIQ